MALAGNKNDMYEHEEVEENEGKDLAKELGAIFQKTSAKESTNVSDAFVAMTREIIKSQGNKKKPTNPSNNVVVTNAPSGQTLNKKGGCCK